MKKPNFKELNKLVQEGYLRKVSDGDLQVYNYTDACTYDRKWNKHTLNARGTVYNKDGSVLAKAFPKFFNFSELSASEQKYILKLDKFTTYEKMDGSLGIIYNHNNAWRVNTRGSFESEQAIEGLRVLNSKYDKSLLNKNYTYLNEIITPETKIIIDYKGKEFLPCLAIYDVTTGKELSKEDYLKECKRVGFETPKIYEFSSIEKVIDWKKSLGSDDEGAVVLYEFSGEKRRVKFKSDEYLAVARILSNVNYLSMWGNLIFGEVSNSYIEKIPEEFRSLIEDQENYLKSKFKEVLSEVKRDYGSLVSKEREDKAREIQEANVEHTKALFILLNGFPSDSEILAYQEKVEKSIDSLRKSDDPSISKRIGPNELRMRINKMHKGNLVNSLENYIMGRIRPKGNKV